MVAEYNTSAQNQGIPESEMLAQVGNLLDPKDPSPPALSGSEFRNFDIAVVGLGFHHFDDPYLAAKRLTERLKEGGVLLIMDFLPHQQFHSDHASAKTVAHLGFSEEETRKIFEEAGAGTGFEYVVAGKGIVFVSAKENGEVMRRTVFIARGVKGKL